MDCNKRHTAPSGSIRVSRRRSHGRGIEYIKEHIECIRIDDDTRLKDCTEYAMDDFETIRVIGKGSYATVTCSRHRSSGKFYAIKYLDKDSLVGDDEKDSTLIDTLNEISLLSSFQNSRFLNCCYGYVQTKTLLGIVMKFQPGGELFRYIGDLPSYCKLYVAAEVLAALEELHHRGVMYRDLKAENILFDKDNHIVLTDFGFAKRIPSNGRTLSVVGTVDYMAPEIVRRESYGYEADIWSYGVLLYEIMCSMPPFSLHEATGKTEKFSLILDCHLSFPCGLPPSFVDLAGSILQVNSDRRPSIPQIKQHAFFKDIDWEMVCQKKTPQGFLPPITFDEHDITRNFSEDVESQDEDAFEDF